jgi:hypothetical protein
MHGHLISNCTRILLAFRFWRKGSFKSLIFIRIIRITRILEQTLLYIINRLIILLKDSYLPLSCFKFWNLCILGCIVCFDLAITHCVLFTACRNNSGMSKNQVIFIDSQSLINLIFEKLFYSLQVW